MLNSVILVFANKQDMVRPHRLTLPLTQTFLKTILIESSEYAPLSQYNDALLYRI
jgi:hypothetical protein